MVSSNLQLKLYFIFIYLNILSIRVCSGQNIVDCEDEGKIKGIGIDQSNKCFVFLPQADDNRLPPLNFLIAKDLCSSRGFKLAEITNFGESLAVSAHIRREYKLKNPVDYRPNFILAGKESAGGDFQYIDGRPLLQQGCYISNFKTFIDSNREMTPEKCIQDCKSKGYSYASVKENGYKPQHFTDCYCDNILDRSSPSRCSKRCTQLEGKSNYRDYFCGSNNDRSVSAIYRTDGIFSIFDYNQPSWARDKEDRDSHNCILLKSSSRYDDQECFKPDRSALCELTKVDKAGCESKKYTWIDSVNKCINFNRQLFDNWFQARDSCYSLGGDLAVIDSKELFTRISEIHETSYKNEYFWIGASNRQYTWTTTNTSMIFSRFLKSTAFSTKENCFALNIDIENQGGEFGWVDIDCNDMSKDNGVLCMSEIKTITTKPTTKLTTTFKSTKKPTDKPKTTKTPTDKPKPESTTGKVIEKSTKKTGLSTEKVPSKSDKPTVRDTFETSIPINTTVNPTISTKSTSQSILKASNIKESANLELDIGVIIVICLAVAAIIGGIMRVLAYVLIAKTTEEEEIANSDGTLELQDQTNNVNYFQNQIIQNEDKGLKNEQFNY
ncbi:DgyrCDS1726 [Dimorphilus gyrociliatus]|uniref:DgyrCDS1726 n=1 Tax=Dimorphilus gyrociliatus TaxID=2664684 RepID=A0A7I8VBD5_9ANNE|nr:DgyrCDS1726 [Dimorphilus gyrociliatus]